MKRKQSIFLILLTVVVIHFLVVDRSYSSQDNVSGQIEDGYRILNLETEQEFQPFTVYRGDYIKFRLSEKTGETTAVFPTLKQEKKLTSDLKTTAYFKMKETGTYPFQVGSLKGQIIVLEYQQKSYTALSSKDADAVIKTEKPFVLDVRTRQEYAMGHLENSVLIPVQELKKRIQELDIHKNNAILIYCATGNRSTVASKILIDSGFKKIFNLRYGFVDWVREKYPVVGSKE